MIAAQYGRIDAAKILLEEKASLESIHKMRTAIQP
jgi:hypothetical protein